MPYSTILTADAENEVFENFEIEPEAIQEPTNGNGSRRVPPRPQALEIVSVEEESRRSARVYPGLAILVTLGLAAVVAIGALGITGPGLFEVGTAMAMIGGAIAVLAIGLIVALVSMRRTVRTLAAQEDALARQVEREARRRQEAQLARDREQDARLERIAMAQQRARLRDAEAESRREAARMATSPATAKLTQPVASTEPGPFGKIYHAQDIEGIGPTYAKRLERIGIKDTEALWRADPMQVAQRISVPPKMVQDWQDRAELMAVQGIGNQYAELLSKAEIHTIEQLASASPAVLYRRIEKLEAERQAPIQKGHIGVKTVEKWIESAKRHYRD
jgi:predicted flap endonuclease-1-like 5' DNA nuclease